MTVLDEIRRHRRVQAAEGYLDLITVFAEQWTLTPKWRDALARRALDELKGMCKRARHRGYVYYLRGQALRTMERYREAIVPLGKAAKLDGENIHVHLALAWCYKRTQRLDLAIQSLEEAISVAPEEGIIHYNLACYWSLAGNKRLALQYLSQSFELDPNYRDLVSGERDFDPIRNDPQFRLVTSLMA